MTAPHGNAPDTQARTEARLLPDRQEAGILVAVLGFLVLWAAAVAIWGLPGLYLPALALVPVVWAALIAVSRG
ncbi:MAG: hypothetical protein M5U35_08395 [Roseovarius sp.]|nr:hypothetical protein [Roseovarius sp.]